MFWWNLLLIKLHVLGIEPRTQRLAVQRDFYYRNRDYNHLPLKALRRIKTACWGGLSSPKLLLDVQRMVSNDLKQKTLSFIKISIPEQVYFYIPVGSQDYVITAEPIFMKFGSKFSLRRISLISVLRFGRRIFQFARTRTQTKQ